MISIFLALLLGLSALDAVAQTAAAPLTPIAALDVPRYMGTWHEIARLPNWFQRNCVADTRAEYSLRPDGQVQVLNRCRKDNGETIEAVGAARQVGAASSPRLEVRFAPAWLALLPLVWGDYWVVDLDEHYQLAAVGEPRRRYLWILSRTPTVEPSAYAALLQRLAMQGFDIGQIQRTPQSAR
jgi:apolipoprotein D and lipocalin family protein